MRPARFTGLKYEPMSRIRRPLIVAHRGASGAYAENTRAAFLHAAVQGADILETDVHLTADGAVVCSHADMVERPGSDQPVPISELPLAQLRELDFHTWMGAEIPTEYGTPADQFLTLPELLEMVSGLGRSIGLLIELKEPFPFGRLLEDRVLEDLREMGWNPESSEVIATRGSEQRGPEPESAVVEISFISFDPESIGYLLESGVPKDKISAVVSGRRHDNAELLDRGLVGIAAPKWEWILESPEHVDRVRNWRRRGIEMNFWALNDAEGIRAAAELGADYITTDYPDIALKVIDAEYAVI